MQKKRSVWIFLLAPLLSLALMFGLWAASSAPVSVRAASPALSLTDEDGTGRVLSVALFGYTRSSDCSSVRVALWSDQNGQDDLAWVSMNLQADGTYQTLLDVGAHGYDTGVYHAHCYVFLQDGSAQFLSSASYTLKSTDAASPALIALPGEDESAAHITLRGVSLSSGTLSAAVWNTENSSDEKDWISLSLQSDGSFQGDCDLQTHVGAGNYAVHLYVFSGSDAQFLTSSSFYVLGAVCANFSVSAYDRAAGTCTVRVSGVYAPGGVKQVQMPFWSGDQSNVVWHTAEKVSDGVYQAEISIADHQGAPEVYSCHLYVTNGNGVQKNLGALSVDFRPTVKSASLTEVSAQSEYLLRLSGLEVPGGAQRVSAAVWSNENGQDDLTWSDMSLAGDTASLTIRIADHGGYGTYSIHLYAYNSFGGSAFLTSCGGLLIDEMPTCSMTVDERDESAGTFTVSVAPGACTTGVSKVEIPVWCAADQSDIHWYTAALQSDGSYRAEVDVSNHRSHLGEYHIHAYVTMGNGVRVCAGGSNYDFSPTDPLLSAEKLDSGSVRLLLQNVPSYAQSVYFPTWSMENGQDDLVWYKGTKLSDGVWTATVLLSSHNSAGTYATHAYLDGTQFLTAVSYTVSELGTLGERKAGEGVAEMLDEAGEDLYSVYLWIVENISSADTPREIPDGYTASQYYLADALSRRAGDSFGCAGAFYWAAKSLGYDVCFCEGTAESDGQEVSRAWVEITLGESVYLCDPAAQRDTGRNGFLVTCESAPIALSGK